jgi:AcrR family transcriptional regulator
VQGAAEQGARELSVSAIVARAGVSRRTFYELFADGEQCVLAAFEHAVQRLVGLVVPAYEAERRWQDRIRAALVALLGALEQERALGLLVVVESLAAGPLVRERRQQLLARLTEAIDAGRSELRQGAPVPSAIVAEGLAGGVCSVLHTRLLAGERRREPLTALANPLMALIVLPYLGAAAARAELARPAPAPARATRRGMAAGGGVGAGPGPGPGSGAGVGSGLDGLGGDPLRELGMRITYRTLRVLQAVAESPGSNNRAVGRLAGIADQGQMSKLLARLQRLGLIRNERASDPPPAANAWRLTEVGERVLGLGG